MLTLIGVSLWAGLVALAIIAGVALRRRLRDAVARRMPDVDDEAVERILETGVLKTEEDEPLDLREIDEAERRFRSESWDEPEEWQ